MRRTLNCLWFDVLTVGERGKEQNWDRGKKKYIDYELECNVEIQGQSMPIKSFIAPQ